MNPYPYRSLFFLELCHQANLYCNQSYVVRRAQREWYDCTNFQRRIFQPTTEESAS